MQLLYFQINLRVLYFWMTVISIQWQNQVYCTFNNDFNNVNVYFQESDSNLSSIHPLQVQSTDFKLNEILHHLLTSYILQKYANEQIS